MPQVTKIDKRVARKRYDANLPIAAAGTVGWFDIPRESGTFTKSDLGMSFDAMVSNSCRGGVKTYAAPMLDRQD